jgi:hypothetical protein
VLRCLIEIRKVLRYSLWQTGWLDAFVKKSPSM